MRCIKYGLPSTRFSFKRASKITAGESLSMKVSRYRCSNCTILILFFTCHVSGVYTKNRTFRLYLSSKAGSSAILKAHHTDAHYDAYLADLVSLGSKPRPSEQALLEFEYFLKTLICSSPFDTDTRLLTMPDGEPLKKTPYCPKAPSGLASSLPAHLTGEKATISRESPFPRIDAYIASIIQTSLSSPSVDPNWKPGYIRSVSFYPQGTLWSVMASLCKSN